MFVAVIVVFVAITVVVVAVAVVVVAVAIVVVVVAVVLRCPLLLFLLTRRSNSGFRFFRSCFYDFLFANALPVPCYNRFLAEATCSKCSAKGRRILDKFSLIAKATCSRRSAKGRRFLECFFACFFEGFCLKCFFRTRYWSPKGP